MDYPSFSSLVKDILNNLYDYAMLEAHPLVFQVFRPPAGYSGTRVEYVRKIILDAIDELRPPQQRMNPVSAEWRPYLLLYKRYVEGVALKDLANLLTVGDRQMRRDHHRALLALTRSLWTQLYPDLPFEGEEAGAGSAETELVSSEEEAVETGAGVFEIHKENLNLIETIRGALEIVDRRAKEAGLQIETRFPDRRLLVDTDRIILRQILIGLFHEAITFQQGERVRVQAGQSGGMAEVRVQFTSNHFPSGSEPLPGQLAAADYWCEPIGAQLEHSSAGEEITLSLRLPASRQQTVLVIDDQPPVLNMFKRFLSQTNIAFVGATQAEDLLPMVRQHRPALIILDVMMPQIDGWETLQMIKLNEETREIPVVICSAWAAPDLALSLGAADFLKKPVTQKALFEVLEHLGIERL